MTRGPSTAFVLDADAFICLHSLSLLALMASRDVPPLYITEYVARHELCTLASHVTAMESSGRLRIPPLGGRDPNFKRFRRDGADKGEAEIVAWCLQSPKTERPQFISNDRKARKLASDEHVPTGDLLDLVMALIEAGTIDTAEAEEKLEPWRDPGQQRCRPADFTTLSDAFTRRRGSD
jgi:hypothetical protein